MKFLAKINRNYLILFALILSVITLAGYFLLHMIILNEAKENLLNKEYLIERQILNTGELPNLYPLIEVQKTGDSLLVEPSIKEVTIRNEMEKEDEIYLEYSNKIKINDAYYLIKLRQSVFENEDLLLIMGLTLFILLLSALIISFFITKKINKTVWADFEHNLKEIENFSLSANDNISLLNSNTEEFDRLNRVITALIEKLKTDYLILKEFTENASHEIQTPLSIILLNLEEILQQDLNESTFQMVITAINATKRLSALNQSLILLARIENRQFKADKKISFKELITRKAKEFSTLFETKNLKVKIQAEQDVIININEELAEILINNLLSNAVNHNVNNGTIQIILRTEFLEICNTGEANLLSDKNIFNRFTSGNKKSFGLGLAIVKKICDTNNLEIHYMKNELHCFTINPKF
jgi:signal transduction histidine kinase